jgi:hypothetical protein
MKGGEKQSERKTQSVRETDRLTERYREKKIEHLCNNLSVKLKRFIIESRWQRDQRESVRERERETERLCNRLQMNRPASLHYIKQ